MKRIIVTENQAKSIVDYIINEQNERKTEALTVDFGAVWPMGKWKLTSEQTTQIAQKAVQITDFITKNKGSKITIQIEAGESQITNKDTEVTPAVELAQGVLSQKRGESMVNFLKNYFQSLVGKVITQNELPNIPEPKTIIGTTPYKKGDITDPKTGKVDQQKAAVYQKEQFVRAIVTASKDYECLVGMEITIGYFRDKSSTDHICDEAIFELRMNGISIGEVNLNNATLDVMKSKITKASSRYEFLQRTYGPLAVRHGYENIEQYFDAVMEITKSFDGYGRKTDGQSGGSRSQTFVLDGARAKSIIDNSPSDKIVLSIVPLVGQNSKYKLFYSKGSHADTPWVTIKSKKSPNLLFNGEPNVGMQRGSTKETILLQTDLCGNPIANK